MKAFKVDTISKLKKALPDLEREVCYSKLMNIECVVAVTLHAVISNKMGTVLTLIIFEGKKTSKFHGVLYLCISVLSDWYVSKSSFDVLLTFEQKV